MAALALYGALQAVDGVANKQADMAWLSAPAAEKAVRFASAEAVRWVEWGLRSYHDFTLGLAVLLFAAAVVRTARIPRPIGYLMGLSGLALLVQGWMVGSEGFSGSHSALIVVTWVLSVAWMIWLVVVAWRMVMAPPRWHEDLSVHAPAAQRHGTVPTVRSAGVVGHESGRALVRPGADRRCLRCPGAGTPRRPA